ncbi:MAG: hypothetical protein Q7K37_00455 [Dehalococcoidia bacterium]|nr:hypothetical protein [Dehalococcoidia bacterium]
MLTTPTRALRRTTVLAVLGAAGLLVACGGGDKAITADQASAVAAAALLTTTDLPAATWAVTENDPNATDDSDDGFFGEAASCQQFEAAFQGMSSGATVEPLAEASRDFDGGDESSLVLRQITTSVAVMPEDYDTAGRVKEMRDLFTADALKPCFEEGFAAAFGTEGVTINSLEVTNPTVKANGDAGAIAVDMDALAIILPIKLHMEIHFWSEGQVGGTLLFIELNSDLLQTNQKAIVDAAAKRVTDAIAAVE